MKTLSELFEEMKEAQDNFFKEVEKIVEKDEPEDPYEWPQEGDSCFGIDEYRLVCKFTYPEKSFKGLPFRTAKRAEQVNLQQLADWKFYEARRKILIKHGYDADWVPDWRTNNCNHYVQFQHRGCYLEVSCSSDYTVQYIPDEKYFPMYEAAEEMIEVLKTDFSENERKALGYGS